MASLSSPLLSVSAFAIAASSAVYGFCSVLAPVIAECVLGARVGPLIQVSQMTHPIPTTPFLSEELVATDIPRVELAVSVACFLSGSIIVCKELY